MKILVTGGAGFIGSHLANKLYDLGNRVHVVDNLSNGKKTKLNPKIDFYKEDITKKDFIKILAKVKPKIIYHLAAQSSVSKSFKNPQKDFQINLLATQDLIETSLKSGVKKIVFSSSAAVYKETSKLPIVEASSKQPLSIYGLAKLSSEFLFKMNYKKNRLSFTSLRYSNVYGPGQDNSAEGGVVAIFIKGFLNGQKTIINGDGEQTRDFIYVSDVVDANIIALNQKTIGCFNISTGVKTSINSLHKQLAEITNKKSKKIYKTLRYKEIKNSLLDFQKFPRFTCWKPSVPLKKGLANTYEHFKNL